MENLMSPPPSDRLTVARRPEADERADGESTGYAIAASAAFASVAGLSLWGLGVAGSFDGPSAALFATQIAGGVVVTVGFAAQAVQSLWRE